MVTEAEDFKIYLRKVRGKDIKKFFAFFSEMRNVGYTIPEDIDALKSTAISNNGEFINTFAKLAKKLNMAITVTFLENYELLPCNSM